MGDVDFTRADFDKALDAVVPRPKQQTLIEPKPADHHVIYAGDCLYVLDGDKYIPDHSVDLIYIDPPWNTSDQYVSFWKDSLDVMAFTDFRDIGDYMKYMTPRLEKLARKLKPTGTFYFHGDWHCIHYIKVELDRIFGYNNFLNEIIWHYQTASGAPKKWLHRNHDVILRYAAPANIGGKPSLVTWNHPKEPWPQKTLDKWQQDENGLYYRMQHKYNKRYYVDPAGKLMDDVWEITLASRSAERLGYPTQKPLELLRRIIEASSNPGDVVLDAFCGCGTALVAAQERGRKWIGIDISHVACRAIAEDVLEARMKLKEGVDFHVWGTDIQYMTEAALERMLPDEFESWAINALQGQGNTVKGRDRGIDGRYYPIDKITYEQIRAKIGQETMQTQLFDTMYNYRPIQVKQYKDNVGYEAVDRFSVAMEKEGRNVGYFVAMKGFTKDALKTIDFLYKQKNIIVVPATAVQMVKGGVEEIKRIHAAPATTIQFETYLKDFKKRAA
ncbi:MAG: restriction endonuclease [bacterium]|nr:restriction endonuclease [bacterium]